MGYVAVIWQIIVMLVTTAYTASQMKVPKGGPAAGADKFQFPTASEDRAIPVFFGRRWAKGPNVVDWGGLGSRAIKQKAGRKYGFFGPQRYTVTNYIYRLTMQLVVGYRVNLITAIKMGDKVLAEGMALAVNGTIFVNKPELFGGEKSGGGFVGNIDIEFGGPAQPVNAALQGLHPGEPVSAYRGVVQLVVRDAEVTAAPPGQPVTIQPVSVRVESTYCMTDWYPAKVRCPGGGMNPVHMLRVCATRQPWNNQQYLDADIDEASFIAAADALYAEDFGLDAEISDDGIRAEDAIDEIIRHIDATLYEDRFTGKLSIKLNRGDYDVASLPLIDDSVVKSVDDYARTGWGERINQSTVSYYDLDVDKMRTTTPIYDPMGVEAQGGVVARNFAFPWVTNGDIAVRLNERCMVQNGSDLAVATLSCNRRAGSLRPGDVFRWSCPRLGIVEVVMRVKRMEYGSLADGSVRIVCVQDIFSLPIAVYAAPPASGWVDPVNDPAPAAVRAVFEAPFWLTGPGAFDPATSGTILSLAGKPTQDATDFEVWAGTPYDEVTDGPGAFSEYAALTAAAPASIGPSVWTVAAGISAAAVGKLALIDSEIVRVDAVGSGTVTVSPGMLDTAPAPHANGARLIVFEDNLAIDPFANGAAVNVKLLPATTRGRLPLADAPTDVVAMNQRHLRPYPPGNLRINGLAYPPDDWGTLTATWAHRDRLQQLSEPLTTQAAASIGPEAGTTYTARWYLDNVLVQTTSAIAGTSDSYTPPAGSGGKSVRVEVESIRAGLASWQRQQHTFVYRAFLVTEEGNRIVTEEGDPIILE